MLDAQEVADRVEISGVLTRYCTAIDSKRFDLLDDVFTEDAMIDYSSSAPDVRGDAGRDEAVALRGAGLLPHDATPRQQHRVRDRRRPRRHPHHVLQSHGWQDEAGELQLFFVGGYYEDKLTRTEAGWRIVERVEQAAWSKGTMPPALPS